MKRGEKSGEEPAEKQEKEREKLGEKLRRGVLLGKSGGHETPVLPSWRLLLPAGDGPRGDAHDSNNHNILNKALASSSSLVSARKLAANLWELHQYRLPLSKMHHGGNGPPPRLRRLHHHHNNNYYNHHLPDPSPSSPDLVQLPL
ncbi:QWRF motif protein [Actinidia rufa]|uniref:QWRF motif protein n=1 Tax=Actinidia rufa TaxID=165716 RepID=A0A7J0FRH2_9ERIC|nr:QWRF motif protein [Actinidia rufa]